MNININNKSSMEDFDSSISKKEDEDKAIQGNVSNSEGRKLFADKKMNIVFGVISFVILASAVGIPFILR